MFLVFSNGVFTGRQLHPHRLGALGQVMQYPLAVTLFKVVLSPIRVFLAFGQHGIDQSGQFVRSSGDSLCLVHAGAHSPVVRAQGRFAGAQRRRSQTKRLRGPVGAALGFASHHFAAGDLGAWTQTQPGRKVLVANPPVNRTSRIKRA